MKRPPALLLALALAGCVAPEPHSDAAVHGPALVGTEWRLAKFQSPDNAAGAILPAAGEVYTMQLNPDGSAAFGLFCNRGTGRWHSADASLAMGSLSIEPGAVTMAACPPSRLERLGMDLAHVAGFAIRDGRLHLNLAMDGGDYV